MDIRTMAGMMGFEADFTAHLLPYEKELMENSSEELPFFMKKRILHEVLSLVRRPRSCGNLSADGCGR